MEKGQFYSVFSRHNLYTKVTFGYIIYNIHRRRKILKNTQFLGEIFRRISHTWAVVGRIFPNGGVVGGSGAPTRGSSLATMF